jgi:hypothetical protein
MSDQPTRIVIMLHPTYFEVFARIPDGAEFSRKYHFETWGDATFEQHFNEIVNTMVELRKIHPIKPAVGRLKTDEIVTEEHVQNMATRFVSSVLATEGLLLPTPEVPKEKLN